MYTIHDKQPPQKRSFLPIAGHCLLILLLLDVFGCKKAYQPPVLQTNPDILIVDGIINSGAGTSTTFRLSRTQPIGGTPGAYTPELTAQVTILGSSGNSWLLREQGNGYYTSDPLSLQTSERYQLKIITRNGSQYLSDTVSANTAPPIDSLSWLQQDSGDVKVNIDTHDPAGNSHYYRWYFTETWLYNAELNSSLTLINGLIYYVDSTNQITTCWRSENSTDILLGNSTALSQDRISQANIATIPRGSQKLSVRYSLLATQYVLSRPAYQYWQILQKNTQNLGSLFDPQPSQLVGNYHCLSNPKEPVIGYLSAGTLQQQRLFIQNSQVRNWDTPGYYCPLLETPQDPANYQIYTYPDSAFGPYYFSSNNIIVTHRSCLDCRLQGGTTQKPSFW